MILHDGIKISESAVRPALPCPALLFPSLLDTGSSQPHNKKDRTEFIPLFSVCGYAWLRRSPLAESPSVGIRGAQPMHSRRRPERHHTKRHGPFHHSIVFQSLHNKRGYRLGILRSAHAGFSLCSLEPCSVERFAVRTEVPSAWDRAGQRAACRALLFQKGLTDCQITYPAQRSGLADLGEVVASLGTMVVWGPPTYRVAGSALILFNQR